MVKRRSNSRYITGAEGLDLIDQAVSHARTSLDQVVQAVDERVKRRGQVRQEQAEAFKELARFRLKSISIDTSTDELSEAEARAEDLLAQHEEFVASESRALLAMLSEIEALEEDRTREAVALAEHVEQQEARVNSILDALSETPDYKALRQALKEASAVTERATQKLEIARTDRDEKGQPYNDDSLFSYLWARKYRTVDYKANGLTRMLDGWVGRLCGYDKAHLTFARLTELPERLAEHVEHVEVLEDEAEEALKAIEISALREGGLEEMEVEAEAIRETMRQLDLKIETAEEAHLARSESHATALQAETGFAAKARYVLAEALRKMSFPGLRVLVAQTIELEDDEIVDGLVKLRAEEMQLDLEVTDQEALPKRHSRELKRIEHLRKDYKRASYASRSIWVDQTVLEDAIFDVRSENLDLGKALKRVRKTIKRRSKGEQNRRRTRDDRSRHYRRDDTGYGLKDVAATVAIEIAKEVLRSGGRSSGFDIDFGGQKRGSGRRKGSHSRGRSDRGRSSRGGYKTGDRF